MKEDKIIKSQYAQRRHFQIREGTSRTSECSFWMSSYSLKQEAAYLHPKYIPVIVISDTSRK